MTNYEKLQAEVLKTRELLAQAVMVMDEDNYYMFKDIKVMVTAVEERLEMANNRKDLGGQEASARISLPYVEYYNRRIKEEIEMLKSCDE